MLELGVATAGTPEGKGVARAPWELMSARVHPWSEVSRGHRERIGEKGRGLQRGLGGAFLFRLAA